MDGQSDETENCWPGLDDDLFAGDGREHDLIACVGWQGSRWYGFSLGYRQAAESVINQLRHEGRTTDALFWPFALCWRHFAEVQLKALLELLDQWHRRPSAPLVTHQIAVLWRHTRTALEDGQLGDFGTDLDAVGRVLAQLDQLDPSGMVFRYPVDRSGLPLWGSTKPANVDMRHFHQIMEGVANYLSAVETGVTVELDARNEYEAEMWEETMQHRW
jgi:hypothetical protein